MLLRIGRLAAQTGLSHDTLRFYEREGLLRSQRSEQGYRHYAPESVARLTLIRLAQGLGFSLAEIREVLGQMDQAQDGVLEPERLAQLLQHKLAQIDARLAELQGLRGQLAMQLAAVCPLRLTGAH